jgi:hypothetical protein
MSIFYNVQPNREPIEFTHFDMWDDDEDLNGILEAWENSLNMQLPRYDLSTISVEEALSIVVVMILNRGYDVYYGDEFIEIYEGTES